VPVVISKQSGVIETSPHVLVADFWDIDEMATKILALLNYRALSKELLTNAQRDMKNITWDQAGEKLVKLYID
jgi:glycogen synthase